MELKNLSAQDLLQQLGLQPRPTRAQQVTSGIGLFVAGAAVGVGVGLLIAPERGRELRADIGSQLREMGQQVPGR